MRQLRYIEASVTLYDLAVEDVDRYCLKGFIRDQVTTHVMVLEDNRLVEKADDFSESWDEMKLNQISLYLKMCLQRGGVVLVIIKNHTVIGFGSIEPTVHFDTYIQMPYLHISAPYRHKGYGKVLFLSLKTAAKKLGVEKLYISTHPDRDTQAFYRSVGCQLAKQVIPKIFDKEPRDIQLEVKL
jgi:GNAT superfamily N-acetyltransferase